MNFSHCFLIKVLYFNIAVFKNFKNSNKIVAVKLI